MYKPKSQGEEGSLLGDLIDISEKGFEQSVKGERTNGVVKKIQVEQEQNQSVVIVGLKTDTEQKNINLRGIPHHDEQEL